MTDLRAALAEGLGTFFLVFVGCGAIVAGASPVAVALAFGFVILALVYALGHVSGAHFNPAITLAFAVTGHLPWRRVAGHWVAQVAGAMLAAFALRALVGPGGATTPAVGAGPAFAIEALATFLLAFVIVAVATDGRAPRSATGLAIGLTVALDALAFGPLTGASMNPARSLGPALANGAYAGLWIYLVAPLVGAALGMLAYELLRAPPEADAVARDEAVEA